MFGRHEAETKHDTMVLTMHQDSDPEMRDEADPDPLVEAMVERLRSGLGSLVAFDEWGRPLAWRQVVRIAAGPTLAALRDAQTAVALGDATAQAESVSRSQPAPDHVIDLTLETAVETAAEQPHAKPTVTYQPTATGWAAAPTTFALRQIELEARRDAGFATPAQRLQV